MGEQRQPSEPGIPQFCELCGKNPAIGVGTYHPRLIEPLKVAVCRACADDYSARGKLTNLDPK